ncbi:hypothetical protein WBK31_17005 [Nonomuraea sp. N2-4H]|uniref:hypothetical protein n=1 Tax=unclassified Nonomuraea TaxID=2593643 RepID=UPI00324D96EB
MEELDAAGSPVYILGGRCGPEEVPQFSIDDTLTGLRCEVLTAEPIAQVYGVRATRRTQLVVDRLEDD